eukprot:1356903-Amorphochlora_amoeboformis.AAC.1
MPLPAMGGRVKKTAIDKISRTYGVGCKGERERGGWSENQDCFGEYSGEISRTFWRIWRNLENILENILEKSREHSGEYSGEISRTVWRIFSENCQVGEEKEDGEGSL